MPTPHVTAVVLAQTITGGLPETVASVLGQHRVPDQLVVVTSATVDAEELDRVNVLCVDADMDWHHLIHPDPSSTSLAIALRNLPKNGQVGEPGEQQSDWLWLMTNSTVAQPNALQAVLNETEVSPSVYIAGAKQVAFEDPRQLHDVGLTVSTRGETYTLVEPGELDQGQYDDRSDVFAVSVPGMLVRADIWNKLDGFDRLSPALSRGVDLCWRARLAGGRVVVVPSAVIENFDDDQILQRIEAINERRQHQAEQDQSEQGQSEQDHVEQDPTSTSTTTVPMPDSPGVAEYQESATWLRIKHCPGATLIVLWLWVLISSFGILLGSLVVKAPGVGFDRFRGIWRAGSHPIRLARSISRASETRTMSLSAVDDLRADSAEIRNFRRSLVAEDEPEFTIGDGTGSTSAPAQDEPTGGHDEFVALATPERNWVGLGAVALLLGLGALSLIGLRAFFGTPALSGGSLVPVTAGITELIDTGFAAFAPVAAGASGYTGPSIWILVLLALTGSASIAVTALMMLAMPLSGIAAWAMAGAITRRRGARVVIGLFWGLAPTLLISLGQGRFFAVVAHLLLPLLVLAVIRATGSARPRRAPSLIGASANPDVRTVTSRPGFGGALSWTASGWVAILMALITAAAPVLLLPLVLIVVLLASFVGTRGKTLWWTPLLSLLLMVPVLFTQWNNLRAIFADPGVPQGYLPANLLEQLLGFPEALDPHGGVASLPWLSDWLPQIPWAGVIVAVISLPVLLLAICGAFHRGVSGVHARVGLLIAAAGLLTGWLATTVPVSVDSAGTPVLIYTGTAVSLTGVGLLMAACSGLEVLIRASTALHVIAVSTGLVTSLVAAMVWLIPSVVPHDILDDARQDAATTVTLETANPDPSFADLTAQRLITGSPVRTLPATAADQGTSPVNTRTLVLERTHDGMNATLVTGAGASLQDYYGTWTSRALTGPLFNPEVATADEADETLRSVAAALTSESGGDPRQQLEDLGVGFVVLRDPDGGEASIASSVDAITGLAPVGLTSEGWLWRVNARTDDQQDQGLAVLATEHTGQHSSGVNTAAMRITREDGQPVWLVGSDGLDGQAQFPEVLPTNLTEDSEQPLRLTLAYRADPGWHAELDGEPLTAVTGENSGWHQQFELPDDVAGKQLRVSYDPGLFTWYWLIPAVALLATILLAIPSPVTRRRPSAPSSQAGPGQTNDLGLSDSEGPSHATPADAEADAFGFGPDTPDDSCSGRQ